MQFKSLNSFLCIVLTIATAAHAVAAPVNLQLARATNPCPPDASCTTCTGLNFDGVRCGFDPNALKCVKREGSGLVTEANAALCPPLQQAVGVSKDQTVNDGAKALLAKMSKHIFEGEPTSKTSGRHTFSSWTAVNKDAGRCDTETKLCEFQLNNDVHKTVFDDRAGNYTQSDVEMMCLIAIKLNLLSPDSKGKKDGAFVVQNKFAHPVCVQHQIAGQGTCYPLGIHATKETLGVACKSTGDDIVVGKTVEIPAR